MDREKKHYLKKYMTAEKEIEDLMRERERWRERGLSVTRRLSDMPRGGSTADITGEAASSIAAIDREISRRILELSKARDDVERRIAAVGDDTLRRLLRLRYIEGCTWEEVAERMHYSYQWVCALHGRALKAVEGSG